MAKIDLLIFARVHPFNLYLAEKKFLKIAWLEELKNWEMKTDFRLSVEIKCQSVRKSMLKFQNTELNDWTALFSPKNDFLSPPKRKGWR